MKVICIYEGKQMNNPKAVFGETYTVIGECKGWELMHEDTDATFYQIAELNPLCRYHEILFGRVSEISETEFERGYNKQYA